MCLLGNGNVKVVNVDWQLSYFFYADVWDGVYGTCSKCYETTARLVSYCHPVEKVTQVSMKRRISKENQSYIFRIHVSLNTHPCSNKHPP